MSTVETARSKGPAPATSRAQLALLVGLGVLASLWALFQWGELIAARAGATPFCSLGGSFDCGAVWDSAFARAVHDVTRVPVAGWGLMWGLVAFVLPLIALVSEEQLRRGVSAALRLTALAGLVSVVGLFGATLAAGAVCIGCIGTYLIVLGWVVLAWLATRSTGFSEAPRGAGIAVGIVIASYAVLFVPGTRTPHALADAGKDAMRKSVEGSGTPTPGPTPGPKPGPQQANAEFDGPPTGDRDRDETLQRFVETLDAPTRQMLSDLLAEYMKSAAKSAMPTPRARLGGDNAAVKIVDFTDPLCGHCASLHAVLDEMNKLVPAGTFSVEPHFFPLDGACNPSVERKWDTDIRCQAVRAQLCLEENPETLAMAQKLIFENQQDLSTDKLFSLLAGFKDKAALQKCMTSDATQKKLIADIDAGAALELEGTPLVLLNGKQVTPFPPLLFALILTHGSPQHPAFKALPASRARPSGHEGHAH
jgi:protein-disulfide isomerase/uncharacterized membrane protein